MGGDSLCTFVGCPAITFDVVQIINMTKFNEIIKAKKGRPWWHDQVHCKRSTFDKKVEQCPDSLDQSWKQEKSVDCGLSFLHYLSDQLASQIFMLLHCHSPHIIESSQNENGKTGHLIFCEEDDMHC